ncbi:MAG: hypothetical protein FJ293_09360 [Planctomycetes bacterium]|nr:hypothetical protein [Planctomycetota bacterium]
MPSALRLAPAIVFALPSAPLPGDAPPIPLPLHEQRPLARGEPFARFTFPDARSGDGFVAAHACRLAAESGALQVQATGDDPYFHLPPLTAPAAELVAVRLRGRASRGSAPHFYWRSDRDPAWSERQAQSAALAGDGEWQLLEALLPVAGTLLELRLDPADGPGTLAIESIELTTVTPCPLRVTEVRQVAGPDRRVRALVVTIESLAERELRIHHAGATFSLAPHASARIDFPARGGRRFEAVPIEFAVEGFAPFRSVATLIDRQPALSPPTLAADGLVVELAPDGSGALVKRGGTARAGTDEPVEWCWIAPLLAPIDGATGHLLPLTDGVVHRRSDRHARLVAREGALDLEIDGDRLRATVSSPGPVEALVVRPAQRSARTVLPGVEFLGRGERSSSDLDLVGPARLRYAPPPDDLCWPLLATELQFHADAVAGSPEWRAGDAALGLTWERRDLRPLLAQPNTIDGEPGPRLALRGHGDWQAELLLQPGPLEEMTATLVATRGLPPPRPLRALADAETLARAAFAGPLRQPGAVGFGHCAEPNWERQPWSAIAATLWRLDGRLPAEVLRHGAEDGFALVDGGCHHRDDAAWFVAGRARDWVALRRAQAAALQAALRPDGTFADGTPFAAGHFADTALGVCARNAAALLEQAWWTGDEAARHAGLTALARLADFDLPRGAQTWELPLHSPDLLAAAHAVHAHVIGAWLAADVGDHAATERWSAQARRQALNALPFIRLWGGAKAAAPAAGAPIDDYATIAAFAATHRTAPVWIGLPVQWCGLVAARAFAELAPLDPTFPWATVARGVLAAGEAMQRADGPHVGCLPDAFRLADQAPLPAHINPATLLNLRWQLDGRPHDLHRLRVGAHIVVSPWPFTPESPQPRPLGAAGADAAPAGSLEVAIAAPDGASYDVLVDGSVIHSLRGRGRVALP